MYQQQEILASHEEYMYSHCNIFVLCQVDCGKGFSNLQLKYINGTTCILVNRVEKTFYRVIFQHDASFQ